jgi:hypothetical protein
MIHPKTYFDLLESCKAADCFSWFRDSKTITVLIDDKPADLMTSITARIEARKCGVIDIRTVCGFDPVKNYWGGGYVSPCGEIELPDKRGKKALLDWIRAEAVKQCEWIPNPATLHTYRKQ